MALARDKASGNPSKEFFVSMLTRDITLDDCILDLVDNSIDGAWEQSGVGPSVLSADDALSDFAIDIEISGEDFRIRDNCGGITLEQAADYAFTFGRRVDQEHEDYSVGVYGIGMKRAIFKMGRDIKIRSTYDDDTGGTESFIVPIEVDEWLSRQPKMAGKRIVEGADWDFDIEAAEPLDSPGVDISINRLVPDIATRLGDPTYPRHLRTLLGRDYMVPLLRGLRLRVNGIAVTAFDFAFRSDEDFEPLRTTYDDGPVKVEIFAGMISPPPDSPDPEESDREQSPYGWYVVCNGRVVLDADKTRLTGWGDDLPKWHRQYDGFMGVVFFSAEEAGLLPMTTTKRSVDISSSVYRRALTRMYEPSRTWISYTNARKADLEAAKLREATTQVTPLVRVAPTPEVRLPSRVVATRERVGNINYAIPVVRLKALASALGDPGMTYRDIGIRSFDFTYDELVEDSD